MAHPWPDRAISDVAAGQATMIGHTQVRALGMSRSAIAAAVRRRRLHPVHTGVYSLVAPSARPRFAAEHAALLACGPGAALSHASAASVHGLRLPGPPPRDVHVTVAPLGPGRGRRGLCVHRTRSLPRAELVRVGGLPVTSVARTVIDLAATLDHRATERLVDQALTKTSRARLRDALARHSRRPGTPTVRALLHPARPSSDTWSAAEERLLRLLRRAGVPAPEANVALGRYIPDLLWREQRVIVEYDSRAHHATERERRADAARHNDLTSWGHDVLHVTWDMLVAPERLLVWIVAALTRGGWSAG